VVSYHEGLISLKTLRAFRQLFVWFMPKPSFEMTEGVKVWDKFNETVVAVTINFLDFRPCERGRVIPNGLVISEGKGMLNVKLEFVETKKRQ
tara:strand:- start:233 stop:508 length:276 start_codon:yes stop_codon:yes gene_type:complete